MKTILILMFSAFVASTNAQSVDQENLEKYWKYRDQLRKAFMRIGTEEGYSIPASLIIPNRRYGQVDQSTGSVIQWRDATITLGYYWIVLASEYKLLSENNQDVQSTLNELYYAMRAFNRLDMTAEGYLSGDIQAQAESSDLNGFFIRDDVHHNMAGNFAGDPSFDGPIQPDPGNPNQLRSGSDGWTNYEGGGGDETEIIEIQAGCSESLDQFTTILLGLHCVQRLVPDVWVQPTPSDDGFSIRSEALEMIKRVVEYLNDTDGNWASQYSAKEWTILEGVDEVVHNSGSSCLLASFPVTELIKALFDSNYSEMIGEPGEVRWIFREGDLCIDPGNENNQGFDDSEFWSVFQNALGFTAGNYILGNLVSTNQAVSTILAAQGLGWSLAHCNANVSCCEAVDGPVIIEIPNHSIEEIWNRIEDQNIPLYPGLTDIAYLATGDLQIKLDGVPFDMPVISPLPLTEKLTDNDNVHIMLELSVLGNVWGSEYIRDIAYANAMVHIPMLHDLLNQDGNRVSTNYSKGYYSSLLELAPCVGPWADPYNLTHVAEEWASANRLFQPGNRNSGARGFQAINNNPGEAPDDPDDTPTIVTTPDPEYRGYFPGIDYMLIYNLYHLLWQDELPAYKRELSCECISEITTAVDLNTAFLVQPKFPSYKAMKIPIESYLAHDLNVSSSTGVLNVKNDLIICREYPNVSTTLTIEQGGTLNLYADNTITVREGNKIHITSGGVMKAGINEIAEENNQATIILEKMRS